MRRPTQLTSDSRGRRNKAAAPGAAAKRMVAGPRTRGLVVIVMGLVVPLIAAGPASAQEAPGGGFPFGGEVEAELEGSLTMSARATGFGPAGHVVFPVGGEGVCNPAGAPTVVTGSTSEDQGDGHAVLSSMEFTSEPADVLVTDDGAICASLFLTSWDEGEIDVDEDGTGFFNVRIANGRLDIDGTGVFADIIPEGCSLHVFVGDLQGSINGGTPPGPGGEYSPSVTVGGTNTCSAYGLLLRVALGLPTSAARVTLDTTNWHAVNDHEH